MATATLARTLSYRTVGNVATSAASAGASATYTLGAQVDAGVDVPDAAADNTKYALSFGSIADATYLEIQNASGQAVLARVNEHSVTGTLVAGTVTIALTATDGERLSVELGANNGGTPGIVSVRRSAGNVIVESWVVATGIQVLDVSAVTVYQSSPIALADDGMLVIANPLAVGGTSKMSEASVTLTALQVGAGQVAYKVFGE